MLENILKRNKKGLTLVESLIALSVAGTVATGVIVNEKEKAKENKTLNLMHDAMSIVYAVDHRIAIDGYETTNWGSTSWDNIDLIHKNLIKKELTSQNLNTCSGGGWTPKIIKEREITLLECNLWESSPIKDLKYKASLSKDALTGFIDRFDLTISFNDEEAFLENYQDMKYALNNYKRNEYQEITGQHSLTIVKLSSGNELSSSECINSPLDCGFRFTYDISGGNEKIRVDGNNSIINNHLDFIENTTSISPRQCLHWIEKTNPSDGSKYWYLQKDSSFDCGIGIYEKTPVTVDVLAENGNFRTILLDKKCNLLKLNGNKVEVDSGTTTPCGIMKSKDGSEIIQVVENTIATTALINDVFVEKGFINTLDSDILTGVTLNTTDLVAKTLNAKTVEVATEMIVKGDNTFNNLVEFKKQVEFTNAFDTDKNFTIEKDLKVDGDVIFNGGINLHHVTIDGELTVNSVATLSNTKILGNFNSENINSSTLNSNQISTNTAQSKTLMKAPTGNFDNITNELTMIDKKISEMEFVNGYEEESGNWKNVGSYYNCSSWTPSRSERAKGSEFTQRRTCAQKQEKTIKTYGNWYHVDGRSNRKLEKTEKISRVINVIETQSAFGTEEKPILSLEIINRGRKDK
tara:strand:+ start:47057 stop:48961 length:1905 start_codon:yes stop_codon:yes gene_type:complete